MSVGNVFEAVWSIALIGAGTVIALNLRGAAETFHEVIPEYRRWPRHIRGLRILGGVLAIVGAVVLVAAVD
jgi:hypothetical protein